MLSIGLQLSSLTPYLKNIESIRKSFEKIANIGYKYVQLQGVPADVPDAGIASALCENNLECVATQEDYPFGFGADPGRYIERAVACGSKYLTFALMPREIAGADDIRRFGDAVFPIYGMARDAGLKLCFHPITPDFRDVDGVPAYERLLDCLPGDTQLTFCVYSAFCAGKSYEDILKKYAGRVDIAHFKDGKTDADGNRTLTPLGEGEHDWKPVYAACEGAGVKFAFAEQERWERDAFDCAEASLRCLSAIRGGR